jgi:hypothetical protein
MAQEQTKSPNPTRVKKWLEDYEMFQTYTLMRTNNKM